MSVEIQNQYLLQSTNPSSDLKTMEEELNKLIKTEGVKSEAEIYNVSPEQLQKLEFKFNIDERPAFSPEEIATLAITIVLLEPTGRVVEAALLDVWKNVLYPRLLDWADNKGLVLSDKA